MPVSLLLGILRIFYLKKKINRLLTALAPHLASLDMAKRVLDSLWCHWGLSSNPGFYFIQTIFALAKYFK